jgi:hypothetical protein
MANTRERHVCGAIVLSLLGVALGCFGSVCSAQNPPVTGERLRGNGEVARTLLTREALFGHTAPPKPVDDTAVFAVPPGAAEPGETFEGTLALKDPETSGSFTKYSDIFEIIPEGDSPWKHLAAFRYQFVQSGSYLIPVEEGLTITGSPAWNYIVGPGRVWQEKDDAGYMRAALPFALIQRNQNCVHNGEMTFLFSNRKNPKISNVYYQITQETCYPMKFDMWGIASASYTPEVVPQREELHAKHATEIVHKLRTKPIDTLPADFPQAGVRLAAIAAAYKHPENITTYGVMINGVNYTSGCPTRSGEYAFCGDMRLPSYSIAKSLFAGVALMRLGQLYGTRVYSELIKNHIPSEFVRGNWDTTTFSNASDMATGDYNLDAYEADEDSPPMDKFLVDESLEKKLVDGFALNQHYAPPGTKWVYQSSATFILTQAMNGYLRERTSKDADLFNLIRDDVYKPLNLSRGGLTTIRTSNSPAGAPSGYYGLFFIKDDFAKLGDFLNNGAGIISGQQILEPTRLKEALFRASNAGDVGVPILGTSASSALGPPKLGSQNAIPENTRRYAHGFWGKHITPAEFPQYSCDFWVSIMAGYGGNIVALLPNGVTFYISSDGMEFPWVDAVGEIAKLKLTCH